MDGNIVAISDLHIGAPSSLLTLRTVRKRLIEVLAECGDISEFILLGDILDLTMAPRADAWNQAYDFFRELFGAVAQDANIHYVPGNHDHHVWTLLLEQRDIVSRLTAQLCEPDAPDSRPVIEPLRLTGEFGPKNNTFAHMLFPEDARKRVWIRYPFFKLPCGGRPLLCHHGHYFDTKITPLAGKVARKFKEDLEKVEECNYVVLEGLFYFASLGRTSWEFLTKGYWYYELLGHMLNLLTEIGVEAPKVGRQTIKHLSAKYVMDIIRDLFLEKSYVLVFGHTHRWGELVDRTDTIRMYNTGGWLVEEKVLHQRERMPAIFCADDGKCRLIPFEIKAGEIEKVAAIVRNVSPIR